MNSSAHAGKCAAVTSAAKMRAVSIQRMGRIRLPPAKTLYRMALWMDDGCADSAGSSRSRAASTERRSSSKKAGSFIAAENSRTGGSAAASRFTFTFGIKRFGGKLAVGFLEQDFHAAFRLFQLFLAFSRESHAFLEKFHGVIQGKLRALQATDDFLQSREGTLKIRLLGCFRLFGCR